ncbi:hypothetical protein [Fulvivirga ligni]|uniref:hypothetical protein n=1 Tax=Fulvivirga ligni TaxID=2904246 RepID=UPI001F272080|nr:hypothetical protein [Fulvivirga ligni]UII23394.1 hypothetical protein LVD16_09160 [Fulvivirga ligni]
MERSEQLKFCQACLNRQFDINKGVICGLTNDIATFEGHCPSYAEDFKAAEELKQREAVLQDAAVGQPYGTYSENQAEKAVKSGANWFYWIAALSMINSFMFLAESDFGFIVGLGITQIVDGILYGLLEEVSLWGIIPTLFFSGIFVILGYNAHKYSKAAFIAGMIVYGLDSLIFMAVGDYFAVAFHAFAVFMIYKGFSHLKEIKIEVMENRPTLD